jgi:SPP1 gp7 family putative phage head morphogenesis protein
MMLADLKSGLVDALKNGTTRQDYLRNVTPLLQRKGWWGADAQVDEITGEMAGKGLTPRRLATIFDTNLQSAYMAGRYKAFLANVADRPYWQYVAVMDSRTRPAHAALNGRTFRYDDPFWQSGFPPNGFRCRCGVRALDREDLQARGIDLSSSEGRLSEIEVPTSRQPDGPTATVTRFEYAPGKFFAPDAGWNYNPGAIAALASTFAPPIAGPTCRATFGPSRRWPVPDLSRRRSRSRRRFLLLVRSPACRQRIFAHRLPGPGKRGAHRAPRAQVFTDVTRRATRDATQALFQASGRGTGRRPATTCAPIHALDRRDRRDARIEDLGRVAGVRRATRPGQWLLNLGGQCHAERSKGCF